jgi:hypothetical protein
MLGVWKPALFEHDVDLLHVRAGQGVEIDHWNSAFAGGGTSGSLRSLQALGCMTVAMQGEADKAGRAASDRVDNCAIPTQSR